MQPIMLPALLIPRNMLQLGCESLLEWTPYQGKNCCLNGNTPTIQLTDLLTVSMLWMLYMLANIYTRAWLQISPLKCDLSMLICHYYLRCQTFPRSSMEKPEGLNYRSQTPKSLTFQFNIWHLHYFFSSWPPFVKFPIKHLFFNCLT